MREGMPSINCPVSILYRRWSLSRRRETTRPSSATRCERTIIDAPGWARDRGQVLPSIFGPTVVKVHAINWQLRTECDRAVISCLLPRHLLKRRCRNLVNNACATTSIIHSATFHKMEVVSLLEGTVDIQCLENKLLQMLGLDEAEPKPTVANRTICRTAWGSIRAIPFPVLRTFNPISTSCGAQAVPMKRFMDLACGGRMSALGTSSIHVLYARVIFCQLASAPAQPPQYWCAC